MTITQTIAFIGPGVMAEAMISGLLRQKLALPENLIAAGPRPDRCEELARKYAITTVIDNTVAAKRCDILILSIKPQRVSTVLPPLRGLLKPTALVLSIVAGTQIQTIAETLDHLAVIRTMPNTPAQIGKGITVWTKSAAVTDEHLAVTRLILSALGEEVFVDEEYYLDMATAVSGTGPSYVFLLMEAMVDAGVHLGFPRRIAEQLVIQTVRGSVDFYLHSPMHLARLRNQVTSPGGTSAAALYYLEKAGFRTAISRAIWAAYERSVELGRGNVVKIPETKANNKNNPT